MPIRSYRDLTVWQKAVALVVESYRLANALPSAERFGLVSQIRKASTSVPANLAEGYGRASRAEYIRFIGYANGSLKELETHLYVAEQLGYLPPSETRAAAGLADEVGRMLGALRRRLRSPSPKP